MDHGLSEGTWFAVPLRGRAHCLALLARVSTRHPEVGLGYFFGPAHVGFPPESSVAAASPANAVLVCRFGTIGLTDAGWPVLGKADPWARDRWSVPAFVFEDLLVPARWRVTYDDHDVSIETGRERTNEGVSARVRYGAIGHELLPRILADVLHVSLRYGPAEPSE
jgi:hypothetical protein